MSLPQPSHTLRKKKKQVEFQLTNTNKQMVKMQNLFQLICFYTEPLLLIIKRRKLHFR